MSACETCGREKCGQADAAGERIVCLRLGLARERAARERAEKEHEAAQRRWDALLDERERKIAALEARAERLRTALKQTGRISDLSGRVVRCWCARSFCVESAFCMAIRAALADEPATAPVLNQCDGCRAGIPLENGKHRMGGMNGYPNWQSCERARYEPEAVTP